MKKFLVRVWPLIFIFFLWITFSFPYFFQNKVPYASTYQVNFFPPWSQISKFWGPVKNNAMPDVHTQIYPWKKFTIDNLKKGEIPYWNPYSFSGNPHLANYQSAVFSPFNILFFILPFIDAWSILVLFQPILAALFTYLLLREFKITRTGSLIGSIVFMFSGFIVVWMAYGTLPYAFLFLPLAIFAIERWFNRKGFLPLALLAISIPLSFFSGHFQTSLYLLALVALFLGFKILDKLKDSVPIILSFLLGFIISLLQIIPSIQLYLRSVRSETFKLLEAIPFQYLITIIAPDFFGNPVTRNDWFGHYAEWAGFIGIWPLLLGIYAVLFKRDKKILLFGILGLVSLLLAVKSPLASVLISLKIPVISTSALSRIIVAFSFSFAVLAGFGFDKLLDDIKKKHFFRRIMIFFGLIALFFILVWTILILGNTIPQDWNVVAKRNFLLPTTLFMAGAILAIISLKSKKVSLLLVLYFLLATSFDSLRFAQKWMPFDPRSLVYPDVPVVDAIKNNIKDGRIFGNLGGEVTAYYRLSSIEGYDPLYIERYGEFIMGAASGDYKKAERSVVKINRRGEFTNRALDLLGVSLIFHPIADTNQGWAYPVWEDRSKFTLIFQDERFQLFRNNTALERARLFYNYEVLSDKKDIISRFYSNDFDFRNSLILEENPNTSSKFKVLRQRRISLWLKSSKLSERGSSEILSYGPNLIRVKVQTKSPALLFLSDNFYPEWKAEVNSKETKIYRADYSFRAVAVPKGESLVKFSYKPF